MTPPRGSAHSWLTPKARLVASPLGGQGLVAVAPIPQHELVAIWGNRIMTTAELWALPAALQDFPVQLWYDMFVGPMAPDEVEPVDYMNHSCEPTCGVRGSVAVVARRAIAPGEELTFDYGTTDTDRWTLECRCGAAGCRGRMTGDDWRDPAFQARHAGYLSQYVQELIAHEREGTPLVGLPPGWQAPSGQEGARSTQGPASGAGTPNPGAASSDVSRGALGAASSAPTQDASDAQGSALNPPATRPARRGERPGRRPEYPGRPR